jgi:hypothetical protein
MSDDTTVHDSSRNVFADLGLEDSEEYMAKSELAAVILRIVRKRRLTQARPSCWVSANPRCRTCFGDGSTGFPPTGCFASSPGWAMTCRSG